MKLLPKLLLGFLSVACFVALMGIVQFTVISHIENDIRVIAESNIGEVEHGHKIAYRIASIGADMNAYLLKSASGIGGELSEQKQRILNNLGQLTKDLAAFRAAREKGITLARPTEKTDAPASATKEIAELDSLIRGYHNLVDETFRTYEMDGVHRALSFFFFQYAAYEKRIRAKSKELAVLAMGEIQTEVHDVDDAVRTSMVVMGGIALAAFALAVLIGLSVSRSLSKRTTQLIQATHAFREGLWDEHLPVVKPGKGDEIDDLAWAFRDMASNLKKSTASVDELNHQVRKREQAEKDLRTSHERFLTVLDSIDATIYAADLKTYEILFMNKNMIELFGRDMTGETCWEVFRGESKPCDHCTNDQLVDKDGNPTGVCVWQDKNPITERWYVNYDRAITWTNGRLARIQIATDITDIKTMEEKLQRAGKMEAVGTLAGGVAHDLNNVLSGLVSYPELILMELPEDSPLREPILTIQNSGKKAATIVHDLLTLARRGVAVNEVTHLNDVVEEYLQAPEYKKLREYYPQVAVNTDLTADLLNIMASPVHLSKTVMNLVSNAAEALSGEGTITISTKNQYIDSPVRGYDEVKAGDYIVLTVADDGPGISPEDLERIFEPFYTKKVMGRSGTGLGMAVVWGTVKDHNGYIDVESTEGKGTIFRLYFPVTRKEATKEEPVPLDTCMGHGETVLVVDDVKEQREVATMLLKKLGYSVNTVSNGEDAIAYVDAHAPDIMVLDMIMDPGIDGHDTYKKILENHPGQKAVIASGFSHTDRVKAVQKLGAGQYVKKPYTLEKIGLAVKAELNR